jgi:nitrate/TMAO reductase-like tetraheme cytochrome c subunit
MPGWLLYSEEVPMKLKERIRRFFVPPPGSARIYYILPYVVLAVVAIVLLGGGTYGWEYANSPKFCGTTCHTMPPQDAVYKISPHANVYCTECHIGRASVAQQFARKTEDMREVYSMVFHTYEYPIVASRSRPARETCEQCHKPEAFTADSLRVITHFATDEANTSTSTYLVMKTGGGSKTQGLGRGIHWHIVNRVAYYSTDSQSQTIPFIRVYNDDGTTTDYVDVQSGFDPSGVKESDLKDMDCITCHNRVTHNFKYPAESVDEAMARGVISPTIPYIRLRAVSVLTTQYASREDAMKVIDSLEQDYNKNEYPGHEQQVGQAMQAIREIYDVTAFPDQKVDWTTHPNNLGHINSPGCFRCHDGKHLNAQQQAVRLECNLCHSIPVVAGATDLVARIEISRGPEPESHLNPNWISLHNQVFDATCANCHNTADAGGTSNTSFCSNSACHGNVFTFAGFDAPKLREALQLQLPVAATPAPVVGGVPTFDANIGPIFAAKCTACHGATDSAPAGLHLNTYAGVMAGGTDGPVVVPGDSDKSRLVQVQSAKHFVNLSADELKLVIQWILAGAPEK